jgi:hypothetical protein
MVDRGKRTTEAGRGMMGRVREDDIVTVVVALLDGGGD